MPTISLGTIPMEHGLAVAGILFCLGLVGLMVRRNTVSYTHLTLPTKA